MGKTYKNYFQILFQNELSNTNPNACTLHGHHHIPSSSNYGHGCSVTTTLVKLPITCRW